MLRFEEHFLPVSVEKDQSFAGGSSHDYLTNPLLSLPVVFAAEGHWNLKTSPLQLLIDPSIQRIRLVSTIKFFQLLPIINPSARASSIRNSAQENRKRDSFKFRKVKVRGVLQSRKGKLAW